MGWVRVDDSFYDHGKFSLVGPLGVAMWLTGLAHCNRNLTDGVIRRSVVRRLIDLEGLHWKAWEGELVAGCETVDPIQLADLLVEAGLWDFNGDDYIVHDYHDYQPSSEQVRAERAKAAARQSEWRTRRNTVSNAVTSPVTDPVSDSPVTGAPNPKPLRTKNTCSTESSAPDRFDEFWTAYPKRVAKQSARRRWNALIKRGVNPVEIITGATAYARQVRGTEPQFIKQPDGWLNAGRWEDEPGPSPLDDDAGWAR